MTEVFKTNLDRHYDVIRIKEILLLEFPEVSFRLDLLHKDKLLYTEGNRIPASRIVQLVKHEGFYCEIFDPENRDKK